MLQKFLRFSVFLSILLVLALAVSGCGKSASGSSSGDQHNKADKSSSEPLVVYLNDFDNIIGPAFEKATGYKIKLVTGNGAEIMSRIEAEKNNPHWDVVWMDSLSSIHSLGTDGQLLENWDPKGEDGLTDEAKAYVPKNKTYYPTGISAAGLLVYNSKKISASEAPKTWSDLTKPQYKNIVGMADPAVAAPAYPYVSWFFEHRGTNSAKNYFNSLFKNGMHIYPKNPQVASALTSGEISVAALQESNAYPLAKKDPSIKIVWPEDGAPGSVRVAAIQKNTTHEKAAKAFVAFLLDPKTQQLLIDKGDEAYFTPSVQNVNAKADRDKNGKIDVANAEWASKHEAEIKQWFADKAVK